MRWSIKSLLARIGSRNRAAVAVDQDTTRIDPMEESLDYQSVHSSASDTTFYDSATDKEDLGLSSTEEEMDSNSLDIIIQVSQDTEPRERHLRFSVDFDQNYTQDQGINELVRRLPKRTKVAIKSILKSPTKGRKNKAKRKTLDQASWQAAGYSWKEKATLREREFMQYMWEMINDQETEEEENRPSDRNAVAVPPYDLDSYDIITPPPSVLDLTVYDDAVDEFGLFFNKRFIVTNLLMEGSPCGLCEPNALTGVRLLPEPVVGNVRTATVLNAYQEAPEFIGEYLNDDQEEQRYKDLQKRMVNKANQKDPHRNPLLEEFKNGTWRLTIFEESEEASAVDVRRQLTSEEIRKMFGLSDAGSIILSVDHIDVVQGKCGFNRGKATKRFLVPLGEEATDRSRMRDIRRKWSSLFSSYSFAFGNFFGHPRNKPLSGGHSGGPGEAVSAYALSLAQDQTTTFSRNIENFITCTKDSREMSPQIMMRNMRQFMSGMKNYLVKHGEGDFHNEVQRACGRLKPDEFLNLDTILEGVMHKLVVLPLREHVYGLFVDFYSKTNDIQLLVENVKYALGKTAQDIGIRKEVQPPSDTAMQSISLILQRLQETELPLEKLELLMSAVSMISNSTGCPKGQQLNGDDFLPLLVYVVAKTGFVGAEIEAEFMWGLLQPSLLSGEAGYCLTALCSAVHVLKKFKESQNEGTGTLDWNSSSMPACSSVLRVIIPDEYNGSLQTRTLPVRPHTTTKEVCRIIAHKARITNPQDYALFQLVDGEETLLMDTDCPQEARFEARGKHCLLAYKRIDAKIAWPTIGSAGFH